MSCSVIRQPAPHRLLQQLDRVAEAPVLARRAPAGPRAGTPASARCRGPAGRSVRRSHQSTTALPARACQGHTPRGHRPAPARRQVRTDPPRTSASRTSRSCGVEGAVAVHHRDAARRSRPRTPACTAAPYPGCASCTTRAPRAAPPRPCRRSSRCRRRSPRTCRGCAGSRPRRAGPSSLQGRTRSQEAGTGRA